MQGRFNSSLQVGQAHLDSSLSLQPHSGLDGGSFHQTDKELKGQSAAARSGSHSEKQQVESLNQAATLFPVNTVQADVQQTAGAIPCHFPWLASLIPRHTTKPLCRACPELSGQEAVSPSPRLPQPTGPLIGPEVCGGRCKPVASR